jgi:serine/threonine protein kinase
MSFMGTTFMFLWIHWLRIAIECAEALGYMHSHMYTQVIHGDIKPANILLDNELRAKISDFGISRLVNTENTLYTLNVIGSIGYMDPMFARTGCLTAKSDVYSFGVVLLELITRKKARKDGEFDLLENFTKALAKGNRRVREMFDSEISLPSNMKTIEQIAQLAGKCLRLELDKRPEMLEVAERLRRLRKSLHQGQERQTLFSWGKKNKQAPADTLPQDSSSNSHNLGSSSTIDFGSIELEDLLRASGDVLGKGTVGITCKATLATGDELVVKRLRGVPPEEFEQHLTMISTIRNEHIAPLQRYFYKN